LKELLLLDGGGREVSQRREEKSHKRGQSSQREAAVKQLRRAVHFLRALGRRALGESIERNDFAPVAKMRWPSRRCRRQKTQPDARRRTR